MIRKFIKKWLGLYDIDDLVAGAHCGCCGQWLPKEIVPKSNTWGLCPHDCSGENSSLGAIKTQYTSLLQELQIIESDIDKTTFSIELPEVWSRLVSIRKRYKVPR